MDTPASDSPAPAGHDLAGWFGRGQTAFVPGGYGEIGGAIAWGLARAGARVAVAGRSAAKAEAFAVGLRAAGHVAFGLAMDARSVDSIRATCDTAAERLGGLDILVNCIGMQREEPIDHVTEAAFDEVVQVNLKAAMFLAQSAAAHQVRAAQAGRAPGRQVHVLSVRAQLGLRERGYSAYCATKGALLMLIRQHAVELCTHRITVNGVAPTDGSPQCQPRQTSSSHSPPAPRTSRSCDTRSEGSARRSRCPSSCSRTSSSR